MFKEYQAKAKFTDKDVVGKFESLSTGVKLAVLSESNMTEAHELLKQDSKHGSTALSALTSDPVNVSKVYQAVKTHRRLLKTNQQLAKDYYAKAENIFPQSTYFT